MALFSEDTRETLVKAVDVGKTVLHYGWVPFVLYVGFTRSSPQPSLIKCVVGDRGDACVLGLTDMQLCTFPPLVHVRLISPLA